MKVLFIFIIAISFLLMLKNSILDYKVRPETSRNLESDSIQQQRAEIKRMIQQSGDEKTYAFLKEKFKGNYNMGHNMLHIFGEELYNMRGTEGIKVCDEEFGFGCIHGFSTQAIIDKGPSVLLSLEASCKETSMEMACTHGLGHGTLEYFGHDNIDKALEACSILTLKSKLYGCKDGVFMEYNFPNLAIANISAEGARALDENNKYSPCFDISEKFRNSCFYSLSQWWRSVSSKSFQDMGQYCMMLDNYFYRRACFLGIGNEASRADENSIETSVEKCKTMPTLEGETVCRAAVYTNYYSRSGLVVSEEACLGLPAKEKDACSNYSIISELRN